MGKDDSIDPIMECTDDWPHLTSPSHHNLRPIELSSTHDDTLLSFFCSAPLVRLLPYIHERGMQTALRALRHFIFGFFVICNAIIASVGVWNNSLPQSPGWNSQITIYLIFLGCFGLSFVFSVIFIELARRHAITSRVWFECAWIGLFWLLYLGGATAVTAGLSTSSRGSPALVPDATCISTKILVAFTWIMSISLLSYFSLLVVLTIYHPGYDSTIWNRSVHKLSWPEGQRVIRSVSVRSSRGPVNPIVAPKPQRAIPPTVYTHRFNHEFDYGIDPPPVPIDDRDVQPLPSDPATPRFPPLTWQEPTQPSLYPSHIQSALQPLRASHPVHAYGHRPQLQPIPPPLGDWPRQSPAVPSSSRPKQRIYPLSSAQDELGQSPQAGRPRPNTSPPRQHPLGPRTLELAR